MAVKIERFRLRDEFLEEALALPNLQALVVAFDGGNHNAFDVLAPYLFEWEQLDDYDGPDVAGYLAALRAGGLFARVKP